MLQLSDIINKVYDLMSVDSDNTTYSTWGRVVPKINSVMHRVLSDRKFDVVLEKSQYAPNIKGGDLQFLRGTYSFNRRPEKIVCKPAEEWDRRLYIASKKDVPTKGRCLVKGTVYKFTLNATATEQWLTIDEDLTIPVEQGTVIEFLYKIPDEAEATYQLFAVTDNNEMEMVYADYRYPTDFQQYWTILYKNGVSLIRIVSYDARYLKTFKLNYFKKIETLKNLTDKTVIPDERWDLDMLAVLVAGELLYETERTDDAAMKLNEWYGNLILFYDKYANTNKGFRQEMWWNRNLQRKAPII